MRRVFFFIVAIFCAATSFASIPRASMLDRASEHASAFVEPLSETRVWASEVLAPFERRPPSELSRALHQAYLDGSTTNASGLGRFLSVDPVLNKGALRKPQLWNRYSYVSNNPLNFVDPDGRLLQLSGCVKDQGSDACKGQMNLYLSTFGKQSGEAAKYLTVGKNGIVGFNGISGSAFAAKFGLMGRATNYLVSNRAATFSLVTGRTATTEGHRGAYFDGGNGVGGTIGIDPSRFPNSKHFFGITVGASEALAHELGHAVGSLIQGHAYDVAMRKALLPIAQIGWGETYASAFQNAWRHEVLGLSTYRSGYSLVPNEFRDSTTADVFP